MNEMVTISMNAEGIPCVSSLQVAEDFGKQHKHVLETIENMKAENSALINMFFESTYKVDGNRKSYKCYDMTRDGFSLLVMGFTGKEALAWKLRYIEAFNKMEQKIAKHYTELQQLEIQARADRATAMRINAENRRLKMLLDNPHIKELSPESLAALGISRMQEATGQDLRHALPEVEKTYSATEVGQMLGVSANKIGKTANAYNLKTKTYGVFVLDKARHSSKQVQTFRYNRKGVSKIAEILNIEVMRV